MLFDGSDQHTKSISLLSEVNVDECEDMFFEGDSPLKENLQVLYRHVGINCSAIFDAYA